MTPFQRYVATAWSRYAIESAKEFLLESANADTVVDIVDEVRDTIGERGSLDATMALIVVIAELIALITNHFDKRTVSREIVALCVVDFIMTSVEIQRDA